MTNDSLHRLACLWAVALSVCLGATQAVAQENGLPGADDIWRHLPGRAATSDPAPPDPAPPDPAPPGSATPGPAPSRPARPVQVPAEPLASAPVARTDDALPTPARTLAQARIVIHYSERRGRAAPEALARQLRAAGTAEVETRAVRQSVERLSIRYFHPADRRASEQLGGMLGAGGPAEVADFTFYRPRPRAGTVEIWLP